MLNLLIIQSVNQQSFNHPIKQSTNQVRHLASAHVERTYRKSCRKVSALAGVEVQHTQATKGGDGFGCSLKGIRP